LSESNVLLLVPEKWQRDLRKPKEFALLTKEEITTALDMIESNPKKTWSSAWLNNVVKSTLKTGDTSLWERLLDIDVNYT